ncbi:MAG: hypothetical protein C0467_30750 [Planctomycetaceae bacterium]|nr:hypothetical protein [Planctomycetaceae bacterium]
MANNSNDNDPKPLPPIDPAAVSPTPEAENLDEVRIEDLPDLGPVDLAELSGDLPVDDPAHEGEIWSERVPGPHALPEPNPANVEGRLDIPVSLKDPSSFAEAGLVDLPDLPDAVENDSAQLFKPPANPIPGAAEPVGLVDNLEPIAPVAPVSGWFDASELNKPADAKLSAQRERDFGDSDLFGGPPAKAGELMNMIESSDIFSGGPIPDADLAATSDVLLGAALDYATTDFLPPKPGETPAVGSPSELPLGVMPEPEPEPELPPGTLLEAEEYAEEIPERVFDDNDSLFDGLGSESPGDHFSAGDDSSLLSTPLPPTKPATPPPAKATDSHLIGGSSGDSDSPLFGGPSGDSDSPLLGGPSGDSELRGLGITPDFGATPPRSVDASSILADLSVMGTPPRYQESASEVRLDSPEFGRTIGGDANDGTEFGLGFPEDHVAAEGADSASIVWNVQPEGDVSHDAGTVPEVSLEDVHPASPKKLSDRTEKTPPVQRTEDAIEGDSSVEFSDFPDADDESTASQVFDALLAAKSNPTVPNPKPEVKAQTDDDLAPTDWDLSVSEADLELPHTEQPPTEANPPIRAEKGSKGSVGDLAGMPIKRPSKENVELSESGKTGPVPSLEKTDLGKTKLKAGSRSGESSSPSVEIDWMSGSMAQQPISSASASRVGPVEVSNWGTESFVQKDPAPRAMPEPVAEEIVEEPVAEHDDPIHDRQTKPDMSVRPEPRRSGKGGWLGGTLVGAVLAGGACAGAYFGGFLPNASPQTGQVPPGKQTDPEVKPGTGAKPPTAADVAAAVRAGDAAKAKQLAATIKDATSVGLAAQGEAEFFALVQDRKDTGKIAVDHPDLTAIQSKLKAVHDDVNTSKTPESTKAAVKATIQLGVTYQLAGDDKRARDLYIRAKERYPDYASTFDAALDRIEATAPETPMPDGSSRGLAPADAFQLLLATTVLLQDEPPAKADDSEAGVFFWKAVKLAKAENYTEAVELIKKAKIAHVKQAKAMAGRGLNPLSDPLEQIFPRSCDDLKAFWELQYAISENKTLSEAFKKDGAMKALAELEKKAAGAVKLMTDLKDATEKLTTAAKDLKDSKDLVAKLEKDFKEAEEAKVATEKKLDAEEKARKGADEIVMAVVKELQAAKLLPEKYDSAELLAAQKRALDRATGPSLGALLSPEMMAVGGFGLSAGQLVDIAERLAKAERTSKIATDKLSSEVKRLTTEHSEAMKKLADAHATDVAKLKDDQIAELKKATDKYAAEAKKLTDGFEAKIKALDDAVAAEKKRTEEIAAKFKTDLGNAVTPAQAIDLWLPLLVELRRPADSEGALAAAGKSLTTSQPDSEDVGKAQTVAGLALLFQNKFPEAKARFLSAKSNPKFEAALAEKKLWATAAEIGLESVTDPLAAYRRPPVLPNRDHALAARFLDTGVKAYNEGRFKDAVAAFTESTKADATDAVAWYFLGASKLALGTTDQGKDDIRQGAAREAASNVPTRVISRALSPIQGPARDAITTARP